VPVVESAAAYDKAKLAPNLIYAGSGHEVKTVIVAGKVLVRDDAVLIADEAAVRAEAQTQAEEVARWVTADQVHKEMALLEAMQTGFL
jgi:5-methylthioadenosine/S-adenosylhomocysteine deaminase